MLLSSSNCPDPTTALCSGLAPHTGARSGACFSWFRVCPPNNPRHTARPLASPSRKLGSQLIAHRKPLERPAVRLSHNRVPISPRDLHLVPCPLRVKSGRKRVPRFTSAFGGKADVISPKADIESFLTCSHYIAGIKDGLLW